MRIFSRIAAAALATTALLFGLATPAWAHVKVSSAGATRGGVAILVFSVPNESETNALTTELTVRLPGVGSAITEVMPGWTSTVDRDPAKGVANSVTWKANPGTGIGPGQFALFRVRAKLPDANSVSFPATQTYSDGQVVKWDQMSTPGGQEPEHPAATLSLAPGHAGHDDHAGHGPAPAMTAAAESAQGAHADNTARWLGGIGLILGAAAFGLAVGGRLRKKS